jgi:hypothetical protein
MKEAVRHGYLAGGGLRSPDKKNFYLSIPKNASTYLSNTLLINGWHYHVLGDDSDKITHAMVVLKDPIDRWVSGVGTYISSWILGPGYGSDHFVENYNNLSERLLFETLILDDHTTPQIDYIEQLEQLLPGIPITYFKLDQFIIDNMGACITQPLTVTAVESNISEDHYDQQVIVKFIKSRIRADFTLKAKVVARFQQDYDFINRTQFYYEPRQLNR